MASHRAQRHQQEPPEPRPTHHAVTWIAPGRPDPFRAPGVPDRLVLVLHREGLHYVGKLSIWEYREIEVSRRTGPDQPREFIREMVVDVSMPHEVELHVQMSQRPTAARVVAELLDALRGKLSQLAGRDTNQHGKDLQWIHHQNGR